MITTENSPPDCPYLTIEEASGMMGLSIQMVYVLIKKQRLLAYRHAPKCIRLHRDDVQAYLASIRTVPTSPATTVTPVRSPKLQALKPRRRDGKKRVKETAGAR